MNEKTVSCFFCEWQICFVIVYSVNQEGQKCREMASSPPPQQNRSSNGGSSNPPTQLEFTQAMTDFKVMFPDLEADVIETVLRANNGAVVKKILTFINQHKIFHRKLNNE